MYAISYQHSAISKKAISGWKLISIQPFPVAHRIFYLKYNPVVFG